MHLSESPPRGDLSVRGRKGTKGQLDVSGRRGFERERTLDLLLEHLEVASVRSNESSLSVSLSSNVVSDLLRLLLLGELSDSVAGDEVLEDGEEGDDGESSDARRVGDSFQVGVGVGDGGESEGGESGDEGNLEKEGRDGLELASRDAIRTKRKTRRDSRCQRPLHH